MNEQAMLSFHRILDLGEVGIHPPVDGETSKRKQRDQGVKRRRKDTGKTSRPGATGAGEGTERVSLFHIDWSHSTALPLHLHRYLNAAFPSPHLATVGLREEDSRAGFNGLRLGSWSVEDGPGIFSAGLCIP